jgi:hypothetical protein
MTDDKILQEYFSMKQEMQEKNGINNYRRLCDTI